MRQVPPQFVNRPPQPQVINAPPSQIVNAPLPPQGIQIGGVNENKVVVNQS